MGKLAQSMIKYLIEAEFYCEGIVEKPDVIGAIFGQTEGLLGQDLDLRELQKSGRIGRIEVELINEEGKSKGKILIPSSLDSSQTSLIAASLETIERIGPCSAKVKVKSVKDVREDKRKYVLERGKEILKEMIKSEIPSTLELVEKIKSELRKDELQTYQGLPCGPEILDSNEIIIVEGRADVINLLKNGIRNAIAMNGTSIPEAIVELSKKKITTVFIDGDRGGELLLKKLLQICEIDYVARAPDGKEVEELTSKEIFKSLKNKTQLEKKKELKEFVIT